MNMPQKRNKENQPLPTRWRYYSNAYWYRVPKGAAHLWDGKKSEFRLGTTYAEACTEWAKRMEQQSKPSAMLCDAFDRYLKEIIPNKKAGTQESNKGSLKRLRAAFIEFRVDQVTFNDAMDFFDARVAKGGGPVSAKHDIQVLRHVLTCCVRPWKIIEANPLIGRQFNLPMAVSERVVEPWEVREILSLPVDDQMRCYCEVKGLTGLRRYDMLRLRPVSQYTDGEIVIDLSKSQRVSNGKVKKKIHRIKITPALREAMLRAQSARPVDLSPWLFCRMDGGSYMREDGTKAGTAPAFKTRWQRFQKRLIRETKITETFKETDLRSFAADEFEDVHDAQALLGHASPETTRRSYRRRGRAARPTK